MFANLQQQLNQLELKDIHNRPVKFGHGRKIVLSLFREATCPFCNFRVYELTHKFRNMPPDDLHIIAIFKSDKPLVEKFISRQKRPFTVVADPLGRAHDMLGLKYSALGKMIAMIKHMPAMLMGMMRVGPRSLFTGNLLPADLLIDENGIIQQAYFGQNIGDHIPIADIMAFTADGKSELQAIS